MKKKTKIWISLLLLLIGYVFIYRHYYSLAFVMKENWDLKLPRTSHIETIFNTRNGFPSDGETFYVFTYRSLDNKLKQEDGWMPITSDSMDKVSSLIQKFQIDCIKISNSTTNTKNLFDENSISYQPSDYYFYKQHKDNSYIIALSDVQKQKLYIMEWIQ